MGSTPRSGLVLVCWAVFVHACCCTECDDAKSLAAAIHEEMQAEMLALKALLQSQSNMVDKQRTVIEALAGRVLSLERSSPKAARVDAVEESETEKKKPRAAAPDRVGQHSEYVLRWLADDAGRGLNRLRESRYG